MHYLRGWAGRGGSSRNLHEGTPQNVNFLSHDRDLSYVSVKNGGFDEDGLPTHLDKVWNDSDVPYCSYLVELK